MEKLKWKALHESDFSKEADFLETILKENGVDDIGSFLNPSMKNLHDPFLLNNMERACEMVHKHKNDDVFVYFDVDVDGISGGSIIYNFLQNAGFTGNIEFNMNPGKAHGLKIDYLQKEYKLAIVPDASSEELNDILEWFPELDIVFLDHHDVDIMEFNTNRTVMVNCQDGHYPNNTLCGAGVVQKFIEAYATMYPDEVPDGIRYKYLDMVSLGLIADNMDLRNLESRWYALQGLDELNYNNKGLNALCEHLSDDLPWGRYITSIGWVVAPKINGMIRYGERKEIEELMKSFAGIEETKTYQPRRKRASDPKPDPIEMSIQEWVARNCVTVKNRQDSEVRKATKELEAKITEQGLDKNSMIFVDATKILEKGTVTGLIANKLATKYMRPIILMRMMYDGVTYGGSMRNYSQGNIENLKDYLNGIGIWCAGHANAGGIRFGSIDLDKFIAKVNEDYPLDSLETIYKVDWHIPASEMKAKFVSEVVSAYDVFGNGVPSPRFAISGLKINASNIQTFGEGKFIRFIHNGVTYSKKYCKQGEYDAMTYSDRRMIGANKKELELNLICEFYNEKYEGKTYPTVKIVEFDSTVLKENEIKKSNTIKIDDMDFDW